MAKSRMRVAEPCEVRQARLDGEFGEHRVVARALLAARDGAGAIVEIAEHDGVRGAGLLASRLKRSVGNRGLVLDVSVRLRLANSLDAERALFHHAAVANGDVRVGLHLNLERKRLGPVVEVVPPHLVRAVVGAVPRADAAVVHHRVDAVRRVNGRVDRADLLARRVLAVDAHHRHGDHARVRLIGAHVVAVHPEPVHLATARDLVLADDRNVVLRLASDHTCVATCARIEVDGHAPLVLSVENVVAVPILNLVRGRVVLAPERVEVLPRRVLDVMVAVLGELRVGRVLVDRRHAQDVAALHGAVVLRAGNQVAVGNGLEGLNLSDGAAEGAAPLDASRGGAGAELHTHVVGDGTGAVHVRVDVEQALDDATVTDLAVARELAAVAHERRDGVVWVTGLDPHRELDGNACCGREAHDARVVLALRQLGAFEGVVLSFLETVLRCRCPCGRPSGATREPPDPRSPW